MVVPLGNLSITFYLLRKIKQKKSLKKALYFRAPISQFANTPESFRQKKKLETHTVRIISLNFSLLHSAFSCVSRLLTLWRCFFTTMRAAAALRIAAVRTNALRLAAVASTLLFANLVAATRRRHDEPHEVQQSTTISPPPWNLFLNLFIYFYIVSDIGAMVKEKSTVPTVLTVFCRRRYNFGIWRPLVGQSFNDFVIRTDGKLILAF